MGFCDQIVNILHVVDSSLHDHSSEKYLNFNQIDELTDEQG